MAGDSQLSSSVANLDSEIAKAVVEMGFATRTELDFCREQQKQSSDPSGRSITDLLVDHEFITVNQAKRIRQTMDERRSSTQIPGYRLLGKLGKGAMATVYKAKQISLDRIVAIKVLPRRMSDNPEFVSRFYKEGQAAARLSHNNIVQAIDVASTPDGYHFFVMEYIEGLTLYDVMQPPPVGQGRAITEAEALDVTAQICDALAHAHERGLIHRDVKPKNIILTPAGVAKLTDLGLARAQDDKEAAESEAGKAYGTPYYISPEQIRGDVNIDFRADIYSLGATMYHLVTGRPPFEAETPTAVMHKHLRDPLTPPDHIVTTLSAGISEVIEVAMAKNRDERYASTQDMLEDLLALKRGEAPTHARRNVDLDKLASVEEGGKTVDLVPVGGGEAIKPALPIMQQPWFGITMISALGASVLVNIVLVVVLILKSGR